MAGVLYGLVWFRVILHVAFRVCGVIVCCVLRTYVSLATGSQMYPGKMVCDTTHIVSNAISVLCHAVPAVCDAV